MLPLRIGAGIYADGGWVRNFPLAYAHREPGVQRIVGFRYTPLAAGFTGSRVQTLHRHMAALDRLRIARGVTAELREAIGRQERGEPMHLVDTIARLSHIAVYRNSELEVQLADERDRSLSALQNLQERMRDVIVSSTRGRCRTDLLSALDEAFGSADFPPARSRVVPRLVVDAAAPQGVRLDISRRHEAWKAAEKLALITHGRLLTEKALEGWLKLGRATPARSAA